DTYFTKDVFSPNLKLLDEEPAFLPAPTMVPNENIDPDILSFHSSFSKPCPFPTTGEDDQWIASMKGELSSLDHHNT
ncbi:hypothetical protein HMI56_004087, partial [Coelomomyces lativittatus]